MVLASAFSQVWDTASAIEYWTRMVDVADTHQSHIRSLVSRATFYYNRGLDDDWDLARQDFATAVKELEEDPDAQGPAMVNEQVAYQRAQQAGLELGIGATDRAVTFYADSFQVSNAIAVLWRKQRTLATVGMLVMQQQAVPPKDLLKLIGDELQRRRVVLAEFPAATAALFSVPPDGASFGPPPGVESQPSRPYASNDGRTWGKDYPGESRSPSSWVSIGGSGNPAARPWARA